ncbi:MAG TPA: AAA family ATPase [Candidatus Limnocylindrales bacterium]|nr:AAA family ATPase [Candidatus Limnocylindrales bacterium]
MSRPEPDARSSPAPARVADAPAPPSSTLLVERDTELELLEASLDDAGRGRGRLIVIEGEAGIGKSSLVERLARRAHTKGMRVLVARGTELERQYPYGIAIRLFEPLVVGGPDTFLRGPAAAVAALFQRPGAGQEMTDGFTTIHGLCWLVVNATDDGPFVLVVDDAHWADDATLRFLHLLAQRLSELPVVVVTGFRSTEPESEEPAAAALRLDPEALHLAPRPLTESGVEALLRAEDPAAGAERARETWAATRGNPFLVAELVRYHRAEGATPAFAQRGTPVPERVARFVDRRVRRLDPMARRIAETIAVLEDEATVRRAARLAGVTEGEAVDAVSRLTSAAIVGGAGEVGFIHPLVRASVYQAMPAVARARAHREAALMLDAEHEPLGVVAGQLLSAERAADSRVVELLIRASVDAIGRGEPAVAVNLLRRALAEPPDATRRVEVLRLLGQANVALGSPLAADRYAEALALVGDDPQERGAILLELGSAHVNRADFRAACEAFEQGLTVLGDGDSGLRARLQAGFLSAAWVGMERRDEVAPSVHRILSAPTLGPMHRELAVWTAFHHAISVTTSVEEPLALVRRVLDEAPVETLVREGQLIELAAGMLVTTDELELETDLLTRAIDAAQADGAFAKVAVYSYCRGWPDFYSGRITDAIADEQATLAAAELGWETFVPATHAVLALALVERDQLADAAAATVMDPRWLGRVDSFLVPFAQGRIALMRGDLREAEERFRAASVGPELMGMRSPTGPEWRNWLAIALAGQGRREEAIAVADEALAITRTWGARWPQGPALRAAGIARGGDEGLELLRESVATLEGGPARLELARSLVELGAALRRQGHLVAARASLARGMDEAFRSGAVAILRQSREELRAAGARPRRLAITGLAALTPSEARVARLAASGRTNRQIAEALFVTPKTVEYHLANAYAKLGIESRAALRRALGEEAGDTLPVGA